MRVLFRSSEVHESRENGRRNLGLARDSATIGQQTNSPGPDIGQRMMKQLGGCCFIESTADVKSPQRFQRRVIVVRAQHFAEKWNDGRIAPFSQDPIRFTAIPIVGMP